MNEAEITEAQLRLGLLWYPPHTPAWWARRARWWRLEAKRGYRSAGDSILYSRNMKWAAELARIHGAHPWPVLEKLSKGTR